MLFPEIRYLPWLMPEGPQLIPNQCHPFPHSTPLLSRRPSLSPPLQTLPSPGHQGCPTGPTALVPPSLWAALCQTILPALPVFQFLSPSPTLCPLLPTDCSPDQCPRPSANSKRQHPPSCHSSFNHLLLQCLFPSPLLPTLQAPMSSSGQSPGKGMSEQLAYCLQLTECRAEPCRGSGRLCHMPGGPDQVRGQTPESQIL